MARLFSGHEAALNETQILSGKLSFSLDKLKYNYPKEYFGEGATPQEELERLAWLGSAEKYPGEIPKKIRHQIDHELALIEKLEYAPYFLTVHDIMPFARGQGILCQGRRIGGQFHHLLLHRHHSGRPGDGRSSFRALYLAGTAQAAGYRCRFRA